MNIDEWNIEEVLEYWPNQDTPCWKLRRTRRSDGRVISHVFPKMTLSARSVEYGVPENDTDVLLDIILHEVYVPDPYYPDQVAGADPAVKARLIVPSPINVGSVSIGDDVGVTCHSADTLADAYRAHQLRIEEAKNRTAVVGCDKVNLLTPIHKYREHPHTSALVEDEFRAVRASYGAIISNQRKLRARKLPSGT